MDASRSGEMLVEHDQVAQHVGSQHYVGSYNTNNAQERPYLPTRASTLGSPKDLERNRTNNGYGGPHARSEDMNHSGPNDGAVLRGSGANSPAFFGSSRPMTPVDGITATTSTSTLSDNGAPGDLRPRRISSSSGSSAAYSKTAPQASTSTLVAQCAACSQPLDGAFVRALGNVWHLHCFKCRDCDAVVASKFFPIEGPDGRQLPLCERDYFRRLNLICAKCDQALRGSYITACSKKYHVEHFTCSVCPTVFGPQDSYYEHEGDVYCHFHYSTRFATKCAGCNSAILKQFVEINRNNRDECWHPECYMINKFWNVKVYTRRPTSPMVSTSDVTEPVWVEEEQRENATSLKNKQVRMEQQVYRVWTVLSAFEESSAACISDMLRQVSNQQYLEAIRMAEKFILHVEVLFATIDDLETHFARLNLKGMSHIREARLLCRKTVDLFTLLSRPQESSRRMGMTQELLALVTGLAHYLKILIRIALTGGLKLERDHGVREAMTSFLDKLHLLAVEGGNPSARRIIRGGEKVAAGHGGAAGTQGVTYGFRSLAPETAGDSPFVNPQGELTTPSGRTSVNPPSDLCVKCSTTVEEDCVRLGTYQRWHSHCIQCKTCGKAGAPPPPPKVPPVSDEKDKDKEPPKLPVGRRPPVDGDIFVYEQETAKDTPYGEQPTVIFCRDHGHAGCRSGFQAVSRLEQYAYLLNVALRRLCFLLKRNGLMSIPPPVGQGQIEPIQQESYRDSEIARMKSVVVGRRTSANAKLPKRSTVVESPSGKTAQPTDYSHAMRDAAAGSGFQGQRAQSGTTLRDPNRSPRPPPAQPQMSQHQHQQPAPMKPPRPRLSPPTVDDKGQPLRPPFSRDTTVNTGIMIVDESAPNSPAAGAEDPQLDAPDDGITLADIPQLFEAEQALAQHLPIPSRSSSTRLVAELSPLELTIVKHAALLALYRSPLRNEFDMDEIIELIEPKKAGFFAKFFKGKQKKGTFGVPIEILIEKEGADSNLGASRTPLRVPSFIDDVISAMRQMDMSVEGIFRKNGNIRRLNELTEAIDRDPSSVDLTQDNPVQLAALLKKFLKSLPEPLMTFKLYRLFMAADSMPNEADQVRFLHLVTLLLPKGNRDTTEVLFVFLKWVASFAHVDEETGNKMDLHNLATVISPNIFRSSKGNDSVRVESLEGIRVMDSLLTNQDEFYTVPEEFLPMLREHEYFANCLDLPSKDILKKCDAFLHGRRMKGNGRAPVPALTSPIQGASPFNSSGSGNISAILQDGTVKGDVYARGRQPLDPQRMGAYDRERPPLGSVASDIPLRNGQTSSRQQSPAAPRLQHQPFSYPSAPPPPPIPFQQPLQQMPYSQMPQSMQSMSNSIAFGSPPLRGINTTASSPISDSEWVTQQRPPHMPASGPPSRRGSGDQASDHTHESGNSAPNGHSPTMQQLRQRT